MKKILAILGAVWVLAGPASADMLKAIVAGGAAAAYPSGGPGDITTFSAWYGLRAYSAATAASAANALDLRRSSDNATCTAKVKANGNLDTDVGLLCNSNSQTVKAWATRGTFTGAAISGTSLTFSGLSGTASSGDLIIGTGVAASTKISGACTVSPCTVTISQTVSSTTITSLIPVFVAKIYDQIAGNACGGSSCDLVQGTSANQPSLILNCNGSLPCIQSVATSHSFDLTGANNFTPAAPHSLMGVANRSSGTGAGTIITSNLSNVIGFNNGTANRIPLLIGGVTQLSGVAADASWHVSIAAITNNPGTTVLSTDGTELTTTGSTVNTSANKPRGATTPSLVTLTLLTAEFGFVNSVAFSSGERASLCHNARIYWSTGGSC